MPEHGTDIETRRAEALAGLQILDTLNEEMFDEVAALAKSLLGSSIALISFVDTNRQWFKARIGLDAQETPREQSFCAHAIQCPSEPFRVVDATQDSRFASNPLVTGPPFIRGYLGIPLEVTGGVAVGTLCVIDQRPRSWSEADVDNLTRLSRIVVALLAQRKASLQAERLTDEVAALSTRLAQKRDLLEDMSRVGQIGGWELDLASGELTWTDQTRLIHEVPDSFVPTRESVLSFYSPRDAEAVKQAIQTCIATGEGLSTELPIVTATGRQIQVRSHCALQRSPTGKPLRLLGTVQDITIEHQRQGELTAALTKADRALSDVSAYQAALDKHAIVAMTDARGRITFVNDKFCEISGFDRSELIGANHRILNSGTHPAGFFQDLWRRISGGEPWQGEICNRAKDGRLYWVDTTIVPMPGPNGRPDRYVSVRYDITARKATDAALADALQKANEATVAKSAFVANMSHEIRTPLNGVIAMAGALARTDLDPRQKEMVSLLKSSGETLERLLSDILDLSRIEAGKLTIEDQPFDLRQVVAGATDLMRLRADNKGLAFDVTFEGRVDGQFRGDAVRIRQIVSNLASNAIKFTAKGQVAVRVAIEDRGDGPCMLEIKVTDTGIGFDNTVRDQLFSRFEQADSSITRRFGGSGLGLAICRSLCDMMGGTIDAASQPGVGSTFLVCLPLVRAEHSRAEPSETVRAIRTDEAQADDGASPISILLAEDHPMNQRIVQIILEPLGFNVTIAADGFEAVAAFEQTNFDMILMDMQMPNLDGLAATQRIRQIEASTNRPRTPIAMLSANAMPEHQLAALEAGCDLHISKPVTPESLCAGIEQLLSGPDEGASHVGAAAAGDSQAA